MLVALCEGFAPFLCRGCHQARAADEFAISYFHCTCFLHVPERLAVVVFAAVRCSLYHSMQLHVVLLYLHLVVRPVVPHGEFEPDEILLLALSYHGDFHRLAAEGAVEVRRLVAVGAFYRRGVHFHGLFSIIVVYFQHWHSVSFRFDNDASFVPSNKCH